MTDDDGDDLIEMSGRIVAWNGRKGLVETDCGEHLSLTRGQLTALGFWGPVETGDRIHLYATEHVEVSYHIDRIRLIIPRTSKPASADARRAKSRPRRDVEAAEDKQVFRGVIEAFDPDKGYGHIRASCGELLLLHIVCLRASGYRTASVGACVTCEALRRPKGWQAIRVISAHGLSR